MSIAITNNKYALQPIKNLPKGLIYRPRMTNEYRLIDTVNGKFVGSIHFLKKTCDNSPYYNTQQYEKKLHIYSLKINEEERNKGWGRYLINFAKRESYRQNCQGRCSLVAYHTGTAPHVFYKKMGFVTLDNKLNKYLDECVEASICLSSMPAVDMFIPIKEYMYPKSEGPTRPKNLWNMIKDKFREIITQ